VSEKLLIKIQTSTALRETSVINKTEWIDKRFELTVSPFRRGLHFFPCTATARFTRFSWPRTNPLLNRMENSLIPQTNDSSSTNMPRGRYNPVIETGRYSYGRV